MKDLEIFKEMLLVSEEAKMLQEVEDRLLQSEQIECPVDHIFADGQYMRHTQIPKGTFIVGERHRYSSINILLKGKMTVYNGIDSPILDITAPFVWVSEAGVKKMALMHEDTIWMNPLPTHETDIDKIEDIFYIRKETK